MENVLAYTKQEVALKKTGGRYGGTEKMVIQTKAEVKYALIEEALSVPNNSFCITDLCKIAGVSRSGFYRWQKFKPLREAREEQERADFEQILEAYKFRGYVKAARSIYMRLLHPGIRMNLIKKIRRVMHKYKLICPIRRLDPYKQLARDMRTSSVSPNVLNREFLLHGPRKVLLTDITCLHYQGRRLSTILDAYTREILSYQLSEGLGVEL